MTEAILEYAGSCENCHTVNHTRSNFCVECSFPIGGTEQEKTSFRLIVSSRKRFLDDARDKIKNAKVVILLLAGLFFLFGMYTGFALDDFAMMIVNLFLCVIYLVLAAWCSRNPMGAILTAFIIYITLVVVNFMIDPYTLFQGIILKGIIIAGLVKGVRSAQEAKGYLDELRHLKAEPVDVR